MGAALDFPELWSLVMAQCATIGGSMNSTGSMPISGDVVALDLGLPEGRGAGFRHPAIVVTAQRILDTGPSVVHVVPLTTTLRAFNSEVMVEPDVANGLGERSAAQCQHIRSISPTRILTTRGNVGAVTLGQLRDTIALILDLP